MSLEASILLLRVITGLSLLGFLLALFAIIWRSMRQAGRQLEAARAAHGHLTRQPPDPAHPGGAPERRPLQAITTLGRAATNTIVVNDDFASAEHARIAFEDGNWWLEDRRSRNGTRLNDAAIDQRTILADGDVIGIGRFNYKLKLDSESESSAG